MAQINVPNAGNHYRIVYYGPPGSGKKANLLSIKAARSPVLIGDLAATVLGGEGSCDSLSLELANTGVKTRVHLWAVASQLDARVRMRALRDAHGIIFVADRDRRRLDDNREALQNLRNDLEALGRDFADLPLLFQLNKGDLPDAMSAETLREELRVADVPAFEAVAREGEGVLEALAQIVASVLSKAGEATILRTVARTVGTEYAPAKSSSPTREGDPETAEAQGAQHGVPLRPTAVPSWRIADDQRSRVVPISDPSLRVQNTARDAFTETAPGPDVRDMDAEHPAVVSLSDPSVRVPETDQQVPSESAAASSRSEADHETPHVEPLSDPTLWFQNTDQEASAETVLGPDVREMDDEHPAVVSTSDPSVRVPGIDQESLEPDAPAEHLSPESVSGAGAPASQNLEHEVRRRPETDSLTEPSQGASPAATARHPLADIAPETGRRLVRVGPPPGLRHPGLSSAGWPSARAGSHEPAAAVPTRGEEPTQQAACRLSGEGPASTRCVAGAILVLLWLAVVGYLVHVL